MAKGLLDGVLGDDRHELDPESGESLDSWGTALSRRGDYAGAGAKFKEANKRGPGWADPLKTWGDVLAQEGKYPLALVKYDEALRYAPNWAALKTARSVAAAKTHRAFPHGAFRCPRSNALQTDHRVIF